MEGGGHRSSLPDGDRVVAFGGDDFDACADLFDFGGADEDHFQRGVAEEALADGAVDLASVGVAADADVEGAEAFLSGFSTSLASRIAPAQVPKVGLAWTNCLSFSNPASPRSLRKVPDSPPGMTRPSMSSSCSGFLTSTTLAPNSSSRRRWASKSPWRARTPIIMLASILADVVSWASKGGVPSAARAGDLGAL